MKFKKRGDEIKKKSSPLKLLNQSQHSETTAKGTGLAESAGKEDPVELDSSPTL